MAINQFSDMTEEEFIAKNTGLIIPEERAARMRDFSFESREASVTMRRQLSIIDSLYDYFEPKKPEDHEVKDVHDATEGLDIPDHLDWYKLGKVTRPYD